MWKWKRGREGSFCTLNFKYWLNTKAAVWWFSQYQLTLRIPRMLYMWSMLLSVSLSCCWRACLELDSWQKQNCEVLLLWNFNHTVLIWNPNLKKADLYIYSIIFFCLNWLMRFMGHLLYCLPSFQHFIFCNLIISLSCHWL